MTSFHVYDDGGPNGNFSLDCNGKILLTAPEGKWLRANGRVTALDTQGLGSGWLSVYDGNSTSNRLFNGYYDTLSDITSTGNQMLLTFSNYLQRYGGYSQGFDLTVTVIDAEHFVQTGTNEYTISTADGWNYFCDALQDNDT